MIWTNASACCKASGTQKRSYQVHCKGGELLSQEPGKGPSWGQVCFGNAKVWVNPGGLILSCTVQSLALDWVLL